MPKLIKRLATYDDIKVHVNGPFSRSDIAMRHVEYKKLSADDFRKKYRHYLYAPSLIEIDGKQHELNMNFCCNPFCKWFGLTQKKYENIPGKPSRYKLVAQGKSPERIIACNDVSDLLTPGMCAENYTISFSNWSVGEEIKRLIKVNTVVPIKDNYEYHRDTCSLSSDPVSNPKDFYRRGKSSAGSQKYQCKRCGKITNVLPSVDQCFNYDQKLNAIMVDFAKDVVSRTPITRTCEKLEIGRSTYYNKLEHLYIRCLEFLELHEAEAIKRLHFDEMMLNTDAMIYHLNNIRQKGQSKAKDDIETDEKKLITYLIATADVKSEYVFRSDIAYDFDFNLDQLIEDTEMYNCDRTFTFLRKNQRLAYSYYPKAPDSSNQVDIDMYQKELKNYEHRLKYVEGCHVRSNYTATAQLFLIKQLVNADKWYFVTDDDDGIRTSIYRNFSEEIRSKNSHHFICQYDKTLSRSDSWKKFIEQRNKLNTWARDRGVDDRPVIEQARYYLENYYRYTDLFQYYPGTSLPKQSLGPIKSPLSNRSEGLRTIDFSTDVSQMDPAEFARLVSTVSSFAVDNFFQTLHRRASIMERPLTTARAEGKSYIYCNYHPRYAQYMTTIIRTFYNFCWPQKVFDKKLTPAQRLGIADKAYDIKDIIYFK
jgi:transposase-like protein